MERLMNHSATHLSAAARRFSRRFVRLWLESLENRLLPGESVLSALLGGMVSGSASNPTSDDASQTPTGSNITPPAQSVAYHDLAIGFTADTGQPAPAADSDATLQGNRCVTEAPGDQSAPSWFALGDNPLGDLWPTGHESSDAIVGWVPANAGATGASSNTGLAEHFSNDAAFVSPPATSPPFAAAQQALGLSDALTTAMLMGPSTAPPTASNPVSPITPPVGPQPSGLSALAAPEQVAVNRAVNAVPLQFLANVGEAPKDVQYVVQTTDYAATLSAHGVTFHGNGAAVQVELVGANGEANAIAFQPQMNQTQYFVGTPGSLDGGHSYLPPAYGSVEYQSVYRGVDVLYHSNQGNLEYDFIVGPGANANGIALNYKGAEHLALDGQGNLVIDYAGGQMVERNPTLYQQIDGVTHKVTGGFVLDGTVAHFQVGAYDPTQPLVIDPIVMSSYVDTVGSSSVNSVSVGGTQNGIQKVYITGALPGLTGFPYLYMSEVDYNTANNTAQLANNSLFGGNGASAGAGIATDNFNRNVVYVVGTTSAPEFQVKNSAFAVNGQVAVAMQLDTILGNRAILNYSVITNTPGPVQGAAVAADNDLWYAAAGAQPYCGGAFFATNWFNNGLWNPFVIHLLGGDGVTGAPGVNPANGGAVPSVRETLSLDGSAMWNSAYPSTSPQIMSIGVNPFFQEALPNPPQRNADGTFDYHVYLIGTALDMTTNQPRPWFGNYISGARNNGNPTVLANLFTIPLGFLGYGTGIAIDPASVTDVLTGQGVDHSEVLVGQALNGVQGGANLWIARFDPYDNGTVQYIIPATNGLYTAIGVAVGQNPAAGGGAGSPNNIYVVGATNANGPIQAQITRFLPSLVPSGNPLIFSGSGNDFARTVALATPNEGVAPSLVYMGGITASVVNFPLINPWQPPVPPANGNFDGFLAALQQLPGGGF
jgi:hypothetical protein